MNYKNIVIHSLLIFAITGLATSTGIFIFREFLSFNGSLVMLPALMSGAVLLFCLTYIGVTTKKYQLIHLLLVAFTLFLMKLPNEWIEFSEDFGFSTRMQILFSMLITSILFAILSYGISFIVLRIPSINMKVNKT